MEQLIIAELKSFEKIEGVLRPEVGRHIAALS